MFRRIDESRWLAERIANLSEFVAKRRGLPVVVGISLVILGFVVQIINVYASSQLVELIGVILLNVGILSALIGLLLADPLGK
jgi:uncharacterized membrane protein HdeD (DUF308 family)